MVEVIADLEKKRKNHLRLIKKFAASITNKYSIEEVLADVANNIISKLDFEDCYMYTLDQKNDVLIQKAAQGAKVSKTPVIEGEIKLPVKKGIVGKSVRSGKSIVIKDLSRSKNYIMEDTDWKSELVIPIKSDGNVLGIIDCYSSEKSFFTADHLHLLETISAIISSKMMLLKAYDAVKSQAADLEIINSQYRQSAYVISHDFKSPLANIRGLIEIYNMNETDSLEEKAKIVGMIKDAVDKLEGKVDDLNKVIAARNEPSKTARVVNLSRLLEGIKMGIALQIKDSGAIISSDFNEVKSIKYPRSYLESIMVNLITNAIKYRSKKRTPEIEIVAKRMNEFVVLSVKDNGLGINLEKHGKKLFQLFQRFNYKVEGRGLGLNIVKSQLESLGGKIEVESTVGVGTTFYAYLKDLSE